MGVYGDGANGKKKKGRGEVNAARSLAGLGQGARESGCADWRVPSQVWIAAIVVECGRLGALASFGLSRDRGAYSVGILLDGDRRTIWIPCGDDVDAKLEEIVHQLGIIADE